MSRHLMEPDPDQPEMEPGEVLRVILWAFVVLLGWVELVLFLAERWERPW